MLMERYTDYTDDRPYQVLYRIIGEHGMRVVIEGWNTAKHFRTLRGAKHYASSLMNERDDVCSVEVVTYIPTGEEERAKTGVVAKLKKLTGRTRDLHTKKLGVWHDLNPNS